MSLSLVIVIAIVIVVGFAAASMLAVYSYGRFARRARGIDTFALPAEDGQTELDRIVGPLTADHPGESGLHLLDENIEAFAARVRLARSAGRSLDAMYYYWRDDLTGNLLGRELLAAADRGVRVRLLLDDFNIRGSDRALVALQKHRNIEVRLFNPTRNREAPLRRGLELLLRMFTMNRRMHNKAWIADSRVAVIGGRNIGDAYFDAASQSNFRDLDLLVVGDAVDQACRIFDRFWNSKAALRIMALRISKKGNLPKLRRNLDRRITDSRAKPYLEEVAKVTNGMKDIAESGAMMWTKDAEVISDPPEKANGERAGIWMGKLIFPVVNAAKREARIVSPYFIPGTDGTAALTRMTRNGVAITVLTNSLASTDVAAVHGAYAPYRVPLLVGGVALYELRPEAQRKRISLIGSRTASLHTKAFTVDGETGFIGSFNFDPRSSSINTEMGLIFRHPGLVQRLDEIFSDEISPRSAFRLDFRDGRLIWHDAQTDQPKELMQEPSSSWTRRMVARLVSVLPLESLL